ncbi:MAG TPA: histidine phosphatase family protein [Verrucomicrobiae bacterium]|nr:histidine phosphatase family protein [Verrucomicrobiae bacterium]
MSMPYHFVLVRHGESEANTIRNAALAGDDSLYTAEFINRPDHQFRLTEEGARQAQVTGQWIKKHILTANKLLTFERTYCSPYARSIETAGHLQLPLRDGWRLEYLVRERDFGDIEGLTTAQFQRQYPQNAEKRAKDPLFWKPPGGESIMEVAETRVRELYAMLHREVPNKTAIVVSHGVFLVANLLALEQPTPEEWNNWKADPSRKIHNCQVLHYSRVHPETGEVSPHIRWVRSVCPWMTGVDHPGEWREFRRHKYSNDELLAYAQAIARLNTNDTTSA